jgi:hypothetical protein
LPLSGKYQLTNVTIPPGLSSLLYLELASTQLRSLTLPSTLTGLTYLNLQYNNGLTKITLPAGIQVIDPSVVDLRSNGVQVTLFPVLKSSYRTDTGDFGFKVFADTGTFNIFRSIDLKNWSAVGPCHCYRRQLSRYSVYRHHRPRSEQCLLSSPAVNRDRVCVFGTKHAPAMSGIDDCPPRVTGHYETAILP